MINLWSKERVSAGQLLGERSDEIDDLDAHYAEVAALIAADEERHIVEAEEAMGLSLDADLDELWLRGVQ